MVNIKICGLKSPETLTAAIESGADFVGFVFHPASPRHIDLETARYLRGYIPDLVKPVALLVDPDDTQIDAAIAAARPAMLQLHGQETPARIQEIKSRSKIPVMKAVRIARAEDLAVISAYEDICDWLLFDSGPGGTGQRFDWNILAGRTFAKPWMLAGGLNADNVGEAINMLRPGAVDVSSGVETAPGQKDAAKIAQFITAVHAAP